VLFRRKDTLEDVVDPPDGAKTLKGHQKIEEESRQEQGSQTTPRPAAANRGKVVHFGCLLI